jgi:hypothetical protein
MDYRKHGKHSVIRLKDVAAVERSFIRFTNETTCQQTSDAHLCAKCNNSYGYAGDLGISEKAAHLDLAITLSTS